MRLPAQLTWQGQQFFAETENISPGGALLNIQLPAGAVDIVARIGLRTGKAVRVRARVCWQRPHPPAVGIEFGNFLCPSDPD
jgi:hypothetical protein